MILQEDTRQQKGAHNVKHEYWKSTGVPVYRSKLFVGDYCLAPKKAVDTKASMLEIAQNIGGNKAEHKRFIDELKRAQKIGCELIILIENTDGITDIKDVESWYNPRRDYYENAIPGTRLAKAMRTIQERYGCTFMFCTPEEAAETIIDILR